MRLAISGTHRSGKSTLVELLSDALPGYAVVDEPYHLLEQEGHDFAEMPSLDDFELQLERSLECLEEGGSNVLFDRCPADILAYLMTHEDAAAFDAEAWLARIREALQSLDLVIFVAIEETDVIAPGASEEAGLRTEVDALLREMLLEDTFGFDLDVLPVSGRAEVRFRQVMAYLRQREGR